MDRLTKSAHFLVIHNNFPLHRLAKLYINEIVKIHGVPMLIVSDRDFWFTFRFWPKLHKALVTTLHFSIVFHPQIDGQSEKTIQTLEDILQACVLEFKDNWVKNCHWWNLSTITAIKSALVWPFMKLSKEESVELRYIGMKLENKNLMM